MYLNDKRTNCYILVTINYSLILKKKIVCTFKNKKPLSVEEMYEDVSQDYAKKTITMHSHPHIPGPLMASIHPCKYV